MMKVCTFCTVCGYPALFHHDMTTVCVPVHRCHILYDTWASVSGDLIDTILGEKIKTNRSIGHKCRSFIRALLIDFPVGNLTLMKWVGTNIHGPVITLTPSHPQPLRSGGGGGCWVGIIVSGEVKREGWGGPRGLRHVEQEVCVL